MNKMHKAAQRPSESTDCLRSFKVYARKGLLVRAWDGIDIPPELMREDGASAGRDITFQSPTSLGRCYQSSVGTDTDRTRRHPKSGENADRLSRWHCMCPKGM